MYHKSKNQTQETQKNYHESKTYFRLGIVFYNYWGKHCIHILVSWLSQYIDIYYNGYIDIHSTPVMIQSRHCKTNILLQFTLAGRLSSNLVHWWVFIIVQSIWYLLLWLAGDHTFSQRRNSFLFYDALYAFCCFSCM